MSEIANTQLSIRNSLPATFLCGVLLGVVLGMSVPVLARGVQPEEVKTLESVNCTWTGSVLECAP